MRLCLFIAAIAFLLPSMAQAQDQSVQYPWRTPEPTVQPNTLPPTIFDNGRRAAGFQTPLPPAENVESTREAVDPPVAQIAQAPTRNVYPVQNNPVQYNQTQPPLTGQDDVGYQPSASSYQQPGLQQQYAPALQQYVPAPPSMNRNALFASARSHANSQDVQAEQPSLSDQQPSLSDQQPSLSDPQPSFSDQPPQLSDPGQYDFDNVPAPSDSPGYPVDVQEPELTVMDKARPDGDTGPDYCCRDCRKPWCRTGCVKHLIGCTPSGIEIGGWAQLGYHNRDNLMFNNRRTELNPHQIWLYGEKAADRSSMAWNSGFRIDGLYGTDAQDIQAFGNSPTGNPSGWDNGFDHGSFGSAIPQAYLQLANANWDVKLGKFFSPFGYEVAAAPGNFFYSHSYSRYFNEPFTMSGVLAETQVSANKSYLVGLTAGWDTAFESNENGASLILGSRTQVNPFVNLSFTSSLGDTGSLGSGIFSSAVAQMQLTEAVSYVLQFNNYNLNKSHSYSVVQYLFRDITPCLSLGARLEWWKSDLIFADTKSTYDFSVGANYRPIPNFMVRPELRFDWGAAAVQPGEPIVGVDVIMLF